MHLKQLKLAGFKSFVDPTVVPFSSQLVAVVGPNGCGKSNIIDAVRWVMGESLAKNLRGESMVDVIFKGSSHRKPVGQASVELIFDNSLGRASGQYASYQEIAVKRMVTRDGESFYYLNGTRCRRRDITDIFLGTGAGARGYSIIGQDTISRLIEARPDDLRAYLEEAAGVSKYKERRRETLQRIGHTRENLARVADIRDELEKQLTRLERQAKAAERYTSLKQDERACRADMLALKWQALTTEQQQLNEASRQLSAVYEQHQMQVAAAHKAGEVLQESRHDVAMQAEQRQAQFYQLATDIARLDETIQQRQRDMQRWASDKLQLETDLHAVSAQLQLDHEALHSGEQAVEQLQRHRQALQQSLIEQTQCMQEHQTQETAWNAQWPQVQAAFNQAQRDVDREQLRLQHLEQRHQQIQTAFEKIQTEQGLIVVDALHVELAALQQQQATLITAQHTAALDEQRLLEHGVALRQHIIDVEQQLHRSQDTLHALAIEQATLLAAQNAALRQVNEASHALPRWDANARVAEVMSVADEWLRVFELILADSLHAIVLDSIDAIWPDLPALHGHAVAFTQAESPLDHAHDYPRLSDKITGVMPSWSNALAHIFAADNLEQARAWLPTLTAQQSVLTLDGYWIGQGWVRVLNLAVQDKAGVLSRKQALARLSTALAAGHDERTALTANRDRLYVLRVDNERELGDLAPVLAASQEAVRAQNAQIQQKQYALDHALTRQRILADEYEALHVEVEACAAQKMEVEHQLQLAIQRVSNSEQAKNQLMTEKAHWEEALLLARRGYDALQSEWHQTELQCDRDASNVQQLRDSINREQQQIDTLRERLDTLANRCLEQDAPDAERRALLAQKVTEHTQLDAQLAEGRQQIEALQTQLLDYERVCKQETALAAAALEKRQRTEMDAQALAVRASSLIELLVELDADVEHVLSAMPAGVTVSAREQALLALADQIKRLGAINLLAIEEYQADLQRKVYLDAQYYDLTDALATLDGAIAKLDKETQQRLKDTFDHVNASFQVLFPRLFGGGHATLELTCGNLLEAGILVMAQPPGKRNSTIHMLSGGEKAMTAVALVFAIFQLNPSPFCMLDEVDAPLDDANVRRFCELVKEMSQCVQFLFVTHNKVTMELADHLIGVTMREPGVSRIVAVDVEFVVEACKSMTDSELFSSVE